MGETNLTRRRFLSGTAACAIGAALPMCRTPAFVGLDLAKGRDMTAVATFRLHRYQVELIDMCCATDRLVTVYKPRCTGHSTLIAERMLGEWQV